MKLKVGIIGCGRMANTIEDEQTARRERGPHRGGLVLPYCHAGGYAVVEDTEMVAACDIVEEKRKAFQERWNVPRGYADHRELIDVEKPDILSITTRPEQHAEAMIYGAEHGVKGMYAEKPLCCSLIEVDAIKEAFERNGVFLEFGPMRRNWAIYRQAHAIAHSGELGAVKSVIGFAGNSIGGHFLDTLLYLLGDPDPISIRGTLGELHPDEGILPICDSCAIRLSCRRLSNLITGRPLHAAATGADREYELVCEAGIIRIQNDGESLYVRKSEDQQRAYDPIEVKPMTPWSGTERKVRELVESIKTGRPGISNLRATMLGTEIGFGIYESHLQNGVAVHPPVPHRERWVSSW